MLSHRLRTNEWLFSIFTSEVQAPLFSATMSNEILSLTQRFMGHQIRILFKKELTL